MTANSETNVQAFYMSAQTIYLSEKQASLTETIYGLCTTPIPNV